MKTAAPRTPLPDALARRRFARGLAAVAALAAPAIAGLPLPARGSGGPRPVDVELVLAVDVSRSVDPEEMALQMVGYANAFRDPELVRAMLGGPLGSVGVTLFTWSDWNLQEHLVPWTAVDDARSAAALADAIEAAPRRVHLYTSISGAMDYARGVFARSRFEGTRRVLDVSGDGVNNSGREVIAARDELLAEGVVINGLPVIDRAPPPLGTAPSMPLDQYFADNVVGGPGSFLVVADGFADFGRAVRRKIIREVAGLPGPFAERTRAA